MVIWLDMALNAGHMAVLVRSQFKGINLDWHLTIQAN